MLWTGLSTCLSESRCTCCDVYWPCAGAACAVCALVCQPVYQRHVARAVMYSGRVLELHVLCVHWYDYFSLFISVMLHVL